MSCRPRIRIREQLEPLRVKCHPLRRRIPDPERHLDEVVYAATRRLDVVSNMGKNVGDLRFKAFWQFARTRIRAYNHTRHHEISDPARIRNRILVTRFAAVDALAFPHDFTQPAADAARNTGTLV